MKWFFKHAQINREKRNACRILCRCFYRRHKIWNFILNTKAEAESEFIWRRSACPPCRQKHCCTTCKTRNRYLLQRYMTEPVMQWSAIRENAPPFFGWYRPFTTRRWNCRPGWWKAPAESWTRNIRKNWSVKWFTTLEESGSSRRRYGMPTQQLFP